MSSSRVVGVIGGMGPAATAHFYNRLIALTPASRDQDHVHVIIDSAAGTPDRTQCIRSVDTEPLLRALVESAERLVRAGAELLVMPCNTAHVVFPELQGAVRAPIVDMIGETVRSIEACGYQRPALLATAGTVESGLYQEGCRSLLIPDPAVAALVHHAIDSVKAGRRGEAERAVGEVARRLEDIGADALVVACTDLSTVMDAGGFDLPLVDSSAVLAAATLREALAPS